MGPLTSSEHPPPDHSSPSVSRAPGKKDMAIRPFVEADIPQVVDLYWRLMRQREGSAPLELRSLFHKLYFENPWVDSNYPSLIYEGKSGDVIGFLGIIPRKMSLCGEPVRVAFGGNFIVQPGTRSNLAGPRLLGTYLGGSYAAWQTDSANDISRALLERLGFRTIPALNLHWIRPLKPSHYAIYALTRAASSAMASTLKVASKPICSLADSLATHVKASPFLQSEPRLRGSELDVETLLQCLTNFRDGYSFWAEYDVKPGSVGEVVQVGGDKKYTKDVLDHLFFDAWKQGVIGLHGVVDRRRMADFSDRGSIFTCRGGWNVAFSRNPKLLNVFECGKAFLTRLDGEWCLDPGD